MANPHTQDALHIRKLIREAEALSDEAMLACSKLRQAMLVARQHPNVPIYTGQKALARLGQAEQQALSMSTSLLRVHDELSKIHREFAGDEAGVPTNIPQAALQASSSARTLENA